MVLTRQGSRGHPAALLLAALLFLSQIAFSFSATAASVSPTPRLLQTLVLQPDGANGTDTFLLDLTPTWNYGDNESLAVGPDAVDGSLARSLLRFDLSGIPANATIRNASLELFQVAGGSGTVQVRRTAPPWTEGAGGRSWNRAILTIRETAGVQRTREPVDLALTFAPGSVLDPEADIRVWDGAVEVPSQVYGVVTSGGQIVGSRIVFGATVAAYGTRSYTLTYGGNGTAAPAYRTRTFDPLPAWTFASVGGGASGVSVADLEGDGDLEAVFGTADGYVRVLGESGVEEWSLRLSTTRSIPYTPQLRDVDGDGVLDIVVVTNDPGMAVVSGSTRTALWYRTFTLQSLSFSTPALLEVNGDGVLDVLYGGRAAQVEALSGVDGTSVQAYPSGDWAYTPSIADIDGDDRGEIFFSSDDGFVHAYDQDGTWMWSNAPANVTWPENSVGLADIDGDGIREVLTVDEAQNSPFYALNASTGSVIWAMNLNVSSWREGGLTVGDVDRDGDLEILLGTESGMMFAFDARTGARLWAVPTSTFQPLYPAIVDVDGDGTREIVFFDEGQGAASQLRILNETGGFVYSWPLAANDPGFRSISQFHLYSPAVVDFDGDGTFEIIVPTGSGVQAYRTGGLARDWRTWGYNWNHTHLAYDGNSPDGVAFLDASAGPPTAFPAAGASWTYRDGIAAWASPGGDLAILEATATAGPGWTSWNVTSAVLDWFQGTFPNTGFALLEADEASGPRHSFASSDHASAVLRPILRVTYDIPVVDPVPRITSVIPDQMRFEDAPPWSLNLLGFVSDGDTPASQLRWNVTGYDPAIVTIAGLGDPGNHLLTFIPQPNRFGSFLVTFRVLDPEGNSDGQQVWLVLSELNDPPTFLPPSTFVVRYDEPYRFDFGPYISDVDDASGNLSLWTDDPTRASASGLNVTFLYPESYLDQWVFVTIGVTDGQESVAKVVAVKVTDDRPPVVTAPLPDVVLFEGEFRASVFDLDDYFSDPDNDSLYYTEGETHLTITIQGNRSVDMLAASDWYGSEYVTFRATDPEGALAEDTILVTVIPVDDPPVLGPVPDLRVRYDETYVFDLESYVSDADTPVPSLVVTTSSAYIAVSGLRITLLYPFALNGTVENVTIQVSDGSSVVSRTIRVTVGDDYPPVLLADLTDVSFLEDGVRTAAYNLSVSFSDPDGSQLFYSSGQMNVFVTIDAWGAVDLSATPNWYGTERVTFRATDPEGALAEDTVRITVIPVNDAPYFLPIPAQLLNTTTGFLDLSPFIGDVDTPRERLELTTTSGHAEIVGQGVLFRFPGEASEDVDVFVSDGSLSSVGTIAVSVVLVGPGTVLPPWLYWIPVLLVAGAWVGFLVYRLRRLEWAFLVTNPGLLVASISRRGSAVLDTDLMTGMLTTIMDFARTSFSDEQERNLEGLALGDERVAIVRGKAAYLAVVYKGRTAGMLPRIMENLLTYIETRHGDALGDIVDTSRLGTIPSLLERLVKYGWWPLLTFREDGPPQAEMTPTA